MGFFEGTFHLGLVGLCLSAYTPAVDRGSRAASSWQVLNLLNSPSGVLTPLGVIPSAFLALGLFVVGAYSLGKRSLGGLYLIVAPLPFAIVASALHQYPFHGRLLIFLVPTVHLLVGEGAATLTRKGGARLRARAGCLFAVPAGL